MYRDTFIDRTTTYTRMSKWGARQMWGHVDIALCPSKLRPGYPWSPHKTARAVQITEALQSPYACERDAASFDQYVWEFESYNCTNNETGYYTAFYQVEKASAHGA